MARLLVVTVEQTITFGNFSVTTKGNAVITIPFMKAVTITLNLFDKAGNPTKFDDLPVWATSAEGFVNLAVSEDGYSAEACSVGPMGDVQITATGDADLGDGTREKVCMDTIHVVAGDADTSAFTAGPVVD